MAAINDGAAVRTDGHDRFWYPRPTMVGAAFFHYRVTGKLGVGGMGVVYEAEDIRLARTVALKFLPEGLAGDPEAARRLRREAQTVAGLNHPHICTVYQVDEHEGSVFIAMERVDGTNLKVTWRGDRCRPRRSLTSRFRSWRRWMPRIPRASCTATSSPATSSSAVRDR